MTNVRAFISGAAKKAGGWAKGVGQAVAGKNAEGVTDMAKRALAGQHKRHLLPVSYTHLTLPTKRIV